MMGDPVYLYVISPVDSSNVPIGPVKVGIAQEPWKRAQELQIGSAWPLVVDAAFREPTREDGRQFETQIHEILADYRMTGEWFDLMPDAVLHVIWSIMHGEDYDDSWWRRTTEILQIRPMH